VIQIFGTKKCRNTQRALRFFKERGITVQFRDITVKAPSPGELDDMASALGGYDALLDAENPAARERGLAYMEYDSREELLRDALLYRTPLVRSGKGRGNTTSGLDENAWKGFCLPAK
jgi:arsenate reductase-like glutaredoxin family protein